MRMESLLQLLTLLTVSVGQVLAQQKVMLCYYTNWSQYRRNKTFFPENINTQYCTHLVFSFAKISGNRLAPYEWNDIVSYNTPSGLYHRFNSLKTKNPRLKTLLAVGGFNQGSGPFTAMASTRASRQTFISTSIDFLRKNGFDGLDIDWEYPADSGQGGVSADKGNFAALVRELREAFTLEAQRTGRSRLLLTAAVAAGYSKVSRGYDVPSLSRDLDYISVMAYDLHGSWERRTGHNAGLYTSSTDPNNFSVSSVVTNWAQNADRRKILVGLGTYGRTWTLASSANNRVGAPTTGPGTAGRYTASAGILSYYEICDALNNQGYTRVFDSQTKTPYAYAGDQWITYDDEVSLQYKMTWIRQNGFGGSIVWAIDLDDFDGRGCGKGPYPLLRIIHQCLMEGRNCAPGDGGILPPTTKAPVNIWPPITTTTSTTPTTTLTNNLSPECPYYPGTFPNKNFCTKFWVCYPPNRQFLFTCPFGTVFDPFRKVCDHQTRVDCRGLLL